MGILLKEHSATTLTITADEVLFSADKKLYWLQTSDKPLEITPRNFKTIRGKNYPCFSYTIAQNQLQLESHYFVGVDWLSQDRYLYVEPKINTGIAKAFNTLTEKETNESEIEADDTKATETVANAPFIEIDIIGMLMQIMTHPQAAQQTTDLVLIDWDNPEIPITQKQDLLTPFLIVQFLHLLQNIVRKGLKKSYYTVQENLNNRVKGKIIVGQQVRQNIFKNRLTHTVCSYQVFGIDSLENRFLKKVYSFCMQYVANHHPYFEDKKDISWLINYIRPAFESVSTTIEKEKLINFKHNPFFKEYKQAIALGHQILKRFSYTISKAGQDSITTPPFWIDMSKLFELYVYVLLVDCFPNSQAIQYHLRTTGNELDFVLNEGDNKMVIDAKYKLKYTFATIHEDMRQVAGYARLTKSHHILKGVDSNEMIDCLIIYPDPNGKEKIDITDLKQTAISQYKNIWKLGIKLPSFS